MEAEIQNNLVYLTDHITNLPQVLNYLIQHDIISDNEKETIDVQMTSLEKSSKLLSIIDKKDFQRVKKSFLEILRKTNNNHCADILEGTYPISQETRTTTLLHPKIPKWWPEEKMLIKSLHERKFESRLLVEELHERILKDENRMVVLCESADAAKLTGMGGVGKTLTAKWYAHHYEKKYDHILWIDCGEDSLLKSFKKLAMELKIDNWDKYDEVEDYARNSFQVLTGFECLWIYDNAENYQGEEGIFKVLPKNQKNFFCLITSRSREWGVGNGFPISDLQLEIFSEQESLEFLKANLDGKINRNERQLKELCVLMGNLPLALQLAVAALNTRKIDLQKYIEKTTAEDSGKIVEAKFDDYEKTINKNIKISLDLILKDKRNGKLAFNILMVFGYIRPDNVQSKLFVRMLNSKGKSVKEAIDILEKYFLVTRTPVHISEPPYDFGIFNKCLGLDKVEVQMDLLSVHRLLQQVFRHNGKNQERESLKRILGCEGFIDYKLIPFTKYADEKLQKEFPKVKAELLDQKQLQKLMREKRFDECVQLAALIHQELNTKTTKLNYCVCLEKNGQLEECSKILEEMIFVTEKKIELPQLEELFKRWKFKFDMDMDWELFDLVAEAPTERNVADFLLNIYMRLQNYKLAVEIINLIGSTVIQRMLSKLVDDKRYEEALELAKFTDKQLKTRTTKLNYAICLQKSGKMEQSVKILKKSFITSTKSTNRLAGLVKELFKHSHQMKVSAECNYPRIYVTGGTTETDVGTLLLYCYLRLGNYEQALTIAKQIVTSVGHFIQLLSLTQIPNYHLQIDEYNNLKLDVETKTIILKDCSLSLSSVDRLCPEELTLEKVTFFRDGQELKEVKMNDLVDFTHNKRLILIPHKNNISVDFGEDVFIDYLYLNGHVQVLNWNNSNWKVKQLELDDIPSVTKMNMEVQEITFRYSSLDVSCLPRTIEKLTLWRIKKVFAKGEVELPNLKQLTLEWIDDVSCLTHFYPTRLTHILVDDIRELNVDLLPETLIHLQLTKHLFGSTRIVGGVRIVDKLILKGLSFTETEECLRHLLTHNLINLSQTVHSTADQTN